MTHDQFTYWLQGFVEMNGGKEPTKAQWKMIKDHLQLCFKKLTPPLQPYAKGVGTGGVGNEILDGGISSYSNNYGRIGAYVNGQSQVHTLITQAKSKGGGGGC